MGAPMTWKPDHRERLQLLEFASFIGGQGTFAAFIESALAHLAAVFDTTLVTFNHLDLMTKRATIISRPFRAEQIDAVDSVNEQLDEHPLFGWVSKQHDWPVVRLSDVATSEQLSSSRLYREVLCRIGAAFSLFVFLSAPQSSQWIYLVANRADRDFENHEKDVARGLQPILTAAMSRWSYPVPAASMSSILTRRELDVLAHLATGLTAQAIAHAMGTQPATVRKQLQNVYAKLGVTNRLDAVIQARGVGLLSEEDLSGDLAQRIRTHIAAVPRGTIHTSE